MKSFFAVLLAALFIVAAPATAEEVLGEVWGVQLVAVHLYDDNDHRYGAEIYARNNSEYALYVSIETTESFNIKSDLDKSDLLAEPGENLYLGRVEQDSFEEEWEWQYYFNLRPVCDPDEANRHPSCSEAY